MTSTSDGNPPPTLLDIARVIHDVEGALRGVLPYANRATLSTRLRDLRDQRDRKIARIAYAEWSDADLWRHLLVNTRTTTAAEYLRLPVPVPYGRHVQLLALELGRREALTQHGIDTDAEG